MSPEGSEPGHTSCCSGVAASTAEVPVSVAGRLEMSRGRPKITISPSSRSRAKVRLAMALLLLRVSSTQAPHKLCLGAVHAAFRLLPRCARGCHVTEAQNPSPSTSPVLPWQRHPTWHPCPPWQLQPGAECHTQAFLSWAPPAVGCPFQYGMPVFWGKVLPNVQLQGPLAQFKPLQNVCSLLSLPTSEKAGIALSVKLVLVLLSHKGPKYLLAEATGFLGVTAVPEKSFIHMSLGIFWNTMFNAQGQQVIPAVFFLDNHCMNHHH